MPFDTASYILGQRNAGGGGSSVTVEALDVTENGEYTAEAGKAYSPVNVAVPQTTVESLSVTENGTTTAPSGKAYSPVVVDVPNSYAAGDEGKVVSNGALVAQTAHAEVTQNGTVDTTLNNSVEVNVPFDVDNLANNLWPSGEITFSNNVTQIPAYALADRKGVTKVSAVNATSIGGGAFTRCTEITQITKDDFPNVTTIDNDGDMYPPTFEGCSKLSLIHLPKLTTLSKPGSLWPFGVKKIGGSVTPVLVFPKITVFPNLRSYSSTVYAAIDLGPDITTTEISGSQYFYEGHVRIVIIRKSDAIIAASDTNCIRRVSNTWTFYVPRALVSSYQTASNWSTKYANGTQFLAIEDSIYATQYADGTPIPTT